MRNPCSDCSDRYYCDKICILREIKDYSRLMYMNQCLICGKMLELQEE